MMFVVIRAYSDGSGWKTLARFKDSQLPLDALGSGLMHDSDGIILCVVTRRNEAEWPDGGSWSTFPREPIA
jgi:hypothetical protein